MSYSWHTEPHFIGRNNWLRASVLGANDGLISTASLLMGMASANVSTNTLLLTGLSALIAGAISIPQVSMYQSVLKLIPKGQILRGNDNY